MKQRQLFDKYPQMFTTSALTRSAQILPSPFIEPPLRTQVKSEEHSMNSDNQPDPPNNLYSSIKPIIILGRITFIIPCSRKDATSYKRPSFSLKVIPYLCTIYLLCYCFFQMIFDVQVMLNGRTNSMLGVMNYISDLHYLLDTIMAAIVYIQFLRNCDKFYLIFEKWAEFSFQTNLVKDAWLSPLAYMLATVATTVSFISFILVMNDVVHSIQDMSEAQNLNATMLEMLCNRRLPGFNNIIPFNPVIVIFLMVCSVMGVLTITYVCFLLIFFSRALSFQFKKLIEDATGVKAVEAHYANLQDKDREFWQNIVTKYRSLCLLVKTINNFLSPITFFWVTWNIYILSMQLYRAMVGMDDNGIHKQTFTIDFILHLTRFLASIISAAKINTYAKKILLVLRNCPKDYYQDAEVYRLEHQVSTGQNIGFTGMGCFGLTKPFLLQVFSAIFTMEIILLQSTTQPNSSPSSSS